MRYWDASALVPLVVSQPESGLAREWLAADDHIVTWVGTRTEIVSAIERLAREGRMDRRERRANLEAFGRLAADWDEVTDVLAVRSRALRLLARHPLRAADAGQLGAATLIQEQLAGSFSFMCLDRRLAVAAEQEGLRIPVEVG